MTVSKFQWGQKKRRRKYCRIIVPVDSNPVLKQEAAYSLTGLWKLNFVSNRCNSRTYKPISAQVWVSHIESVLHSCTHTTHTHTCIKTTRTCQ